MKKIAVIGGGSLNWTFGFVRQFAASEHSRDFRLVLMDKNQESLGLVHAAGKKFIRDTRSGLRLEKSASLEKSLDGADFVLVTISTGGLEAMRHDLAIPEKYGIRHTVGDTVGPGGWSRALRNIPVFHKIAATVKRLSPGAWFINMSNPLTILTRVPHKCFGIRSVGMCPGVETMARTLAGMAGASPAKARLDFTVTGIDHGSWFTRLYADGMDVLEELKKKGYWRSDDKLPANVKFNDPLMGYCSSRAVFAVWREIGYMPAISDRHMVENHPWFVIRDRDADLPFSIKRTPIAERGKMSAAARDRHRSYLDGKTDTEGFAGHGNDPIGRTVESLCGRDRFLLAANVPNIGQIPGVPDGAVVETRCLFDAAGAHPLVSPMPAILKALTLPHILRQEAVIDIALGGDFDQLAALMTTDPLCCRLPLGTCRNMARELVRANRPFLANRRILDG